MKIKPASFFVTGTDTGIGKTYVCRLLADALSGSVPATYMKPVQTGTRGRGIKDDYAYVMAGRALPVADITTHIPYVFKAACSPHLAAEMEQCRIVPGHVKRCFSVIRKRSQGTLIVEGAGGLFVPLTRREMMIDLIAALKIPVILVTRPHLGTLNHTFLSITALWQRSIPIAGIVVNNSTNGRRDFIYRDNVKSIGRFAKDVQLLELGYKDGPHEKIKAFCSSISAHAA